jgi:hypothetical protein
MKLDLHLKYFKIKILDKGSKHRTLHKNTYAEN